MVQIPAGARQFPVYQIVQAGSRAGPSSNSMDASGPISGTEAVGTWSEALTHSLPSSAQVEIMGGKFSVVHATVSRGALSTRTHLYRVVLY